MISEIIRLPLSERDSRRANGEAVAARVITREDDRTVVARLTQDSLFFPELIEETLLRAVYNDKRQRWIVPFEDIKEYRRPIS
ncbi:hypothetical protein [Bacillus sp. AK128]